MDATLAWHDRLIATLDQALRTLAAGPVGARPSPAAALTDSDTDLTDDERRLSAALLRVNHAGEMAAQALYHGQALLARSSATRSHLQAAAAEERDHLAWCAQRLEELGGRKSVLDPLWYIGSFCIGAVSAAFGDARSLGFVTETERQVGAHLADHMQRLPQSDLKSKAILEEMANDEARHGASAQSAGGEPLPLPVRHCMKLGGEVLRRLAFLV